MSVQMRQHVERQIARRFISDALKAGYSITVNDSEEDVLIKSTNLKAILDAMFSTDDDHLFLYGGDVYLGWVWFVYGNDGYDVISDYTANEKIEALMVNVNKLADKYA